MRLAIASVSGGKDSTATALLCLDDPDIAQRHFVFADTGNEHDLTYQYVRDYLPTVLGQAVEEVRADFSAKMAGKREFMRNNWEKHGVPIEHVERALAIVQPTGNAFLDLCLWKGRFPSRKAQFCTQELKRYPLEAYLMAKMAPGIQVESWRGVRRDESRNRADAKDRAHTPEGFWIVHPIAAWTAQQTVDFSLDRGVLLNPLYAQGMGRVGCMPCINCRKDELLAISKRFPEHIDKIREWEGLVSMAAKRGRTTFFCDSFEEGETSAEVFERLRIDQRVRWAATSHGGRQQDFVRNTEPEACSSIYGLCD